MTANDDETTPAASSATTPTTPPRRATGTVLAVTGIAVGSALLLGLTFGGGVLVGTLLPDRGPGEAVAAGEFRERLEQRLDERRDRLQDRRDGRDERPQGPHESRELVPSPD